MKLSFSRSGNAQSMWGKPLLLPLAFLYLLLSFPMIGCSSLDDDAVIDDTNIDQQNGGPNLPTDNDTDDAITSVDNSVDLKNLEYAPFVEWAKNLTLYEVNTRQITEEGTFKAFEEQHLQRLSDMGVGVLWFMPIHPIGDKNKLGTYGSHYAVQDYRAVNPNYGTMEDFKNLVTRAHELGMYVIMDWVPNHTAWDNVLTESHPQWYVQENVDFIKPPGTNWSDVIELDFDNQELKDYMIETMRYWIEEADIDGYRVDAASMVPGTFWTDAIPQIKSVKPDILMLAEADSIYYHQRGFDSTFAWGFQGFGSGYMTNVAEGKQDANYLADKVARELNTFKQG